MNPGVCLQAEPCQSRRDMANLGGIQIRLAGDTYAWELLTSDAVSGEQVFVCLIEFCPFCGGRLAGPSTGWES